MRIVRENMFIIKTISIIAHQYRPVETSTESALKLTSREHEFLHWLALGKNYKEIGLIMRLPSGPLNFTPSK